MNRVDTDEESVYVFNNDSRKPLTERSDNLNPFLEDEVPNSIKTSNPDPVVDPFVLHFNYFIHSFIKINLLKLLFLGIYQDLCCILD
jgi:hypothetical protein